jgi:2-methylcitrate dehydratase
MSTKAQTEAATNYAYDDQVADLLAAFTVGVSGELTTANQHAAKRALADSIAVSLGALAHPAFKAAVRHVARFPMPNGPVIWGTTLRSTPDLAALTNGVLLRCYDYNDFFVGRRNSGHPSDMVSGLVVAGEWVGASGEQLLAALAVGYEVVGAVFDAFSTAPGGWDYTNLTAIGATSAIARVMGLTAEQTREALAMTVVPHFASDEVESCELNRRGDLTMWKRFNGSDSVRNALQACLLASVGIEGVVRPFTGKQGFIAKLKTADDPLPVLQERLSPGKPLSRIADTYMKLWPVGSMAQSAIQAALEARAKLSDIGRIKEVRVFSEEGAYQHFVTMRQDAWNPVSRETADHSMPYVVAAAILDGHIGIESFDLDRVLDPRRQDFVRNKVKVTPEPQLGKLADGKLKRAEAGYLSRVEIETNEGEIVHGAAKPFPGHPKAPFSDAEIEQKLRVNAEPFAGKALTDKIMEALNSFQRLDHIGAFTSLLAFDSTRSSKSVAA